MLARSMAAPRRLPFITTLHGTDITLVGSNRSYLPITKFSIEQSDGVTSISRYLLNQTVKDFDIKRPIEVISQFRELRFYIRASRTKRCAPNGAPGGEPIVMHLSNFPTGEADYRHGGNVRARARKNAGEAGADW